MNTFSPYLRKIEDQNGGGGEGGVCAIGTGFEVP